MYLAIRFRGQLMFFVSLLKNGIEWSADKKRATRLAREDIAKVYPAVSAQGYRAFVA